MLAGYSVFSQKRNLPEGLDEDYTVRTGRPPGRELVAVWASLLWDSLPASLHVHTLMGEIGSAQVTSPWGRVVSARRPPLLGRLCPAVCLLSVFSRAWLCGWGTAWPCVVLGHRSPAAVGGGGAGGGCVAA